MPILICNSIQETNTNTIVTRFNLAVRVSGSYEKQITQNSINLQDAMNSSERTKKINMETDRTP